MKELWNDMATLSSTHHQHPSHPQPTTHKTPLYEFLASPIYTSPTQSSDDLKYCPNNAIFEDTRPCNTYMTSLCFPKKDVDDDNGVLNSRRYKRKMKNRESATRSRARRQAYTTELELEVAQLREENAMLRKRQEEMPAAAAAAAATAGEALTHVPKKITLPRSFTAPF